jgi:hypothetical protein
MGFFRTATLVVAIGFMIGSCAGSPGTRDAVRQREPAEGSVLYETDFSADDGMFQLPEGVALSDGALRFDGDNPHSGLHIPYGQDSITEFSLRTAEPQARAELHLLHDHEEGSYIYYGLSEEGVHLSMGGGGEKLYRDHVEFPVTHGEWHRVRIELRNGQAILHIDGEEVIVAPIHADLPLHGHFTPAALNSPMEMDDLRIVDLSRNQGAVTELPPVEGEIIYESSFGAEDDMFVFHRGMAVRDGVLAFIEDNPGGHFQSPYGQDSITQFRLKVPAGDFAAHISVLWLPEEKTKLLYGMGPDGIFHGQLVADELVHDAWSDFYLQPERWHVVRIELREGVARLIVDGRELMETPIHESMPMDGLFFPLAHNSRMQIDDLTIAELPRDEKVAPRRTAAETAPMRALGTVALDDRRIAVVGIKAEDEELAAALASFVSNALVNLGIGRIVERSHVEEIISEHSFQASAITDESTAVEIGMLLGADVITVGSLYQVGTIDYLNIKLIEVQTGEILASSMSSSTVEEEYLRMCNEAVELIGP